MCRARSAFPRRCAVPGLALVPLHLSLKPAAGLLIHNRHPGQPSRELPYLRGCRWRRARCSSPRAQLSAATARCLASPPVPLQLSPVEPSAEFPDPADMAGFQEGAQACRPARCRLQMPSMATRSAYWGRVRMSLRIYDCTVGIEAGVRFSLQTLIRQEAVAAQAWIAAGCLQVQARLGHLQLPAEVARGRRGIAGCAFGAAAAPHAPARRRRARQCSACGACLCMSAACEEGLRPCIVMVHLPWMSLLPLGLCRISHLKSQRSNPPVSDLLAPGHLCCARTLHMRA